MRAFTYLRPESLPEVCEALSRHGEGARVLAGGTDLLVELKRRTRRVEALVSLRGIDELREIRPNGHLTIGAMATLTAVERSPATAGHRALVLAARQAGPIQVRHLATIGGNVCQRSPHSDLIPALLALSASATIAGPTGHRQVPIEELVADGLGPREVLTGLDLPETGARSSFQKLANRGSLEAAIVTVAAAVIFGPDGRCQQARLAAGGAGLLGFRARQAETALIGQPLSAEAIAEAARLASAEARPADDLFYSAAYRKEMLGVLAARALERTNDEGRTTNDR